MENSLKFSRTSGIRCGKIRWKYCNCKCLTRVHTFLNLHKHFKNICFWYFYFSSNNKNFYSAVSQHQTTIFIDDLFGSCLHRPSTQDFLRHLNCFGLVIQRTVFSMHCHHSLMDIFRATAFFIQFLTLQILHYSFSRTNDEC